MNVVNGFGKGVLVKTVGEDEKKMKKVVDEARLSRYRVARVLYVRHSPKVDSLATSDLACLCVTHTL